MVRAPMKTIIKSIVSVVVTLSMFYVLKRSHISDIGYLDSMLKNISARGRAVDCLSGNSPEADTSAPVVCGPGVPCEYPDVVDLRIIVLTYKRWESLKKLLNCINELFLDGDTAVLEIWIDQNSTQQVSDKVVATAKSFRWDGGIVRVHIQEKHVGIFGQWIDTWRPRENASKREIGLILEDDLSISPYAYRWLRAAYRFYGDDETLAGVTIQGDGLIVATNGTRLKVPTNRRAFLYRMIGSWGYSPSPRVWRNFQDWYHKMSNDTEFRPYVSGLLMTKWFKSFERDNTSDSMWTMWFIYYCNQHKLFTLFSNLNGYMKQKSCCLAVNRREPGLHFFRKGIDNSYLLLRNWSEDYINFTRPIVRLGFNGKVIHDAYY